MKRHEFYFAPLPKSPLLGAKFNLYETHDDETDNWYPSWRFEIGFIFFTLSYTNITLS